MRRSVRRIAEPLNGGKLTALRAVVDAYAREKNRWLEYFAANKNLHRIKYPRRLRDTLVSEHYGSDYALPARLWKLALESAAQQSVMYWEAIFAEVRKRIGASRLKDPEKRYAYTLLKSLGWVQAVLKGKKPEGIKLVPATAKQVERYVSRQVNMLRGKAPAVKVRRSVDLDADCYDAFLKDGKQYLKMMSLTTGKRIVIPLKGFTGVSGNVCVTLDGAHVEVHLSRPLPEVTALEGEEVGIDLGYSECFADSEGGFYGTELGAYLDKSSDALCEKGKRRSKLREIAKKHAAAGRLKKARHLKRFNLGEKKRLALKHDNEATLERIVNTSINQLVDSRKPSKIAMEDLSHAFKATGSKKANRRLSRFLKGKMKERLEFKSGAKGFGVEQVNCAYGSQGCPICGLVDKRNRNGDRFKCTHCGHGGHSDTVAARTCKARLHDPEIKLRMKPREVRAVLDSRHRGYLEARAAEASASAASATVHAPTPDAAARRTQCAGKKGGRAAPVGTLRPLGERKDKSEALSRCV